MMASSPDVSVSTPESRFATRRFESLAPLVCQAAFHEPIPRFVVVGQAVGRRKGRRIRRDGGHHRIFVVVEPRRLLEMTDDAGSLWLRHKLWWWTYCAIGFVLVIIQTFSRDSSLTGIPSKIPYFNGENVGISNKRGDRFTKNPPRFRPGPITHCVSRFL